jgi:hypothetical protein
MKPPNGFIATSLQVNFRECHWYAEKWAKIRPKRGKEPDPEKTPFDLRRTRCTLRF